MQTETANYSIKYIRPQPILNTSNIPLGVFNWMPGPFNSSKEPNTVAEFNLNKSLFKDNIALNNSFIDKAAKGAFIGIQEVISTILAQEKHKVSRNEVTEGTYRMTKVRLETNIAEFFAFTDLRRINTASIQQFINFLSDKELSTPTIVGYIAQLRKVLRYLVEKTSSSRCPCFPK